MDTQRGLSVGVLVVLLVGILVAIGVFVKTPTAEVPTNEEEVTFLSYSSEVLGLVFTYQSNYTLQTHEQGNEERTWTTLTLIETKILQSAIENGASEGPPAIAIQIFDNQEGLGAEAWVKGMSYSNYKLSMDGKIGSTTVGGKEALAYQYDGLFATDAFVVAHAGKIYMFSVDWLDAADQNRADFVEVLSSVTFIE